MMKTRENIINHLKHLLNMALADFNIDAKELTTIYELGLEKGISREEIDDLLKVTDQTFLEAPTKVKDKVSLLYDLALVIWADERVEKEEIALMKKIIIQCGFKKENSEEIASYLIEKVKNNISLDKIMEEILADLNEESKIN